MLGGHQPGIMACLIIAVNPPKLPRSLTKGPYIEPEQIADAVVAGSEARAPRIIEPKRWSPLSAMRGVNILADRHLERDQVTLGLIKRIDAEERQRQARRETARQSGFAGGAG